MEESASSGGEFKRAVRRERRGTRFHTTPVTFQEIKVGGKERENCPSVSRRWMKRWWRVWRPWAD